MFDELKKYKNHGHFFFKPGDTLEDESKDVSDLPGVYYIIRLAGGKVELVYIGKSGSTKLKGKLKLSGLRNSINNKEEDLIGQDYFDKKFREKNIDAVDIYWFVTFNDSCRDLPGYVEGLIKQFYYKVYGCLPEWNTAF
ncbi:MAG: hypothetical protein U9R19_01575 [Bacteroidota bacterium]|nr:hypothetical protein [Bacteroidota bacterium]